MTALVAGVSLVAALVLWAVTAVIVVPWSAKPAAPVSAALVLAPDVRERASALRRQLRPWRRISLLGNVIVPLLLGLTPLGAGLVRAMPAPAPLRLLLVVLVLVGLPWLLLLPVAWRVRAVLRAYDLTRQGAAGWWRDRLLALALSVVMSCIALAVVLPVMGLRWWWAVLLGAAIVVTPILVIVLSPLLQRLFLRTEPITAGPVRDGALDLARRAGVRVRDVLVADASRRTTAYNAFVSGLGPSRRVVVYDTLLAGAPAAEVLSVLAHELSHASHRDVLRGMVLDLAGLAVGLCAAGLLLAHGPLTALTGVPGLGRPDSVPLLAALLVVFGAVAGPWESFVSRRVETDADRAGLALTGDPETFVAVHRRLAATNLEDPHPSTVMRWWAGTHPTAAQRLALAGAQGATLDPVGGR